MVVLHVRFSPSSLPPSEEEEDMEFLYECPAAAAVADVAASVATISGLQARLLALSRCLRERCTDERAAAAELERALSEAEAYASKEQVRYNRFLSPHALRNHIKNIEKAAATALVDFPEAVSFQQPSEGKHENIQLWWAGKELATGRKLCEVLMTKQRSSSD